MSLITQNPVALQDTHCLLHEHPSYSCERPDITEDKTLFYTFKIEDVPRDTNESAFTIKGLLPALTAGVRFMLKYEKDTFSGGLVCDEMGLGKIVLSSALVLKNKPHREATVKTTLAVTSLAKMNQWEGKIGSNDSRLSVFAHQGLECTTTLAKLQKYNVVVTTYDTIVAEFKDPASEEQKSGVLFQSTWIRVIADETHTFRYLKTEMSKALASIKKQVCGVGEEVDAVVAHAATVNDHILIPGLANAGAKDEDEDEDEVKEVKEEVTCEVKDEVKDEHSLAISTPGHSTKVKDIVDISKAEPTRKKVMFLYFVQIVYTTALALREADIKCLVYQGRLSPEKLCRKLAVFDQDKEIVVLLCSLIRAVGDLTIASKVVLIDLWWNPIIADQAVN